LTGDAGSILVYAITNCHLLLDSASQLFQSQALCCIMPINSQLAYIVIHKTMLLTVFIVLTQEINRQTGDIA